MSGKGGGVGAVNYNNGKGNSGISGIPPGPKKMVQSLKEIVNCPEAEIYAMLKECNMDPNEAVNRLLTQDPFHEVKSKREKKKESKDSTDSKFRGANNLTHRGGRGGADRYGRGGSGHYSSNDSGISQGRTAYRKENGMHAAHAGTSASGVAGSNVTRQSLLHSDSVATENKISKTGLGDGVSSSSQPFSGFQPSWSGVPGQVSMADIVKMGRPQNKAPVVPSHHSVKHNHASAPPPEASNYDLNSSHASKVSEINAELEAREEWPSIPPSEHPISVILSSVREAPVGNELNEVPSHMSLERGDQHIKSLDDVQSSEDGHAGTLDGNHVGPASVSNRDVQEYGSGGSSLFDDNLYGNMISYQPQRHGFEHSEAEDGASPVAAKLQQLSLQTDDHEPPPEEDSRSVIIPDHLQVHSENCSQLSFGSFGTGPTSFPRTFESSPLKSTLEETSKVVDASSAGHPDTRNPEYYGEEHLRNTADETLAHNVGVTASATQSEVLKEESSEAAEGNQYGFPPSAHDYAFESTQQLNAAFNNQQTSSQMHNISPFSSVMQAYTNSLPSTLLASTVQSVRESDLPYSPFPVTQSMPIKYSGVASSNSGPSISVTEALRAGGISTTQPTPQTLPGANVATGPALQQHLPMHNYSQPTLPLGHFANMITYPILAQSYTYMPSAFQQTYAGNNAYHQSLATMLPQYKNSVSVSSLPQSAAVASGYGFGSSTGIPAGNFTLNPSAAPTGTSIGYDDVLSSQYKDGNHLISLQQNENSAMWVHGHGQRTVSAVPGSTYYSLQGQNQQPGGFRQAQQPLQHFGALGYPNYYSQMGMSLEHQQQNARDGSLTGSQGQPAKQSQQLWQNGY